MSFKKGRAKTGGRQKNVKNKVSRENRQLISEFIFDDWSAFLDDFKKLTERERVECKIKLFPFVIPKLSNTDNKHSFDFDAMTDEQIDRQFDRLMQNNNSDEEE